MLSMCFADEMTQPGIGAELGISQMHVSRLLRQSLNPAQDRFSGLGRNSGGRRQA
jgi:DNA-directed RNA polymerase specialized sigma subunit